MDEGKKDSGLKENFRGFSAGESTAVSDIENHLGITVPSGIRTFYFKGEPRFKTLRKVLAKLGGGSFQPDVPFITDPEHRGKFSSEHKALFVRPDDTFAHLHEVGHSVVERADSNFEVELASGWEKIGQIKDKVARYTLDEGIPQWIAVATSFKKQTSESLVTANLENNKMVGSDPANSTEFNYGKEVVLEKVARVKEQVDAFVEYKRKIRNKDALFQRDALRDFLQRNYRDFISLGYVYTSAVVEAQSKEPGFNLQRTLVEIVKNPPSYGEFLGRVESFDGESTFLEKGLSEN